MVPHPAIIFFILIGIVIVLSAIFGLLGTSVTYEGFDESIGDIVDADLVGAQPAVARRHPLHADLAGGELPRLHRGRRHPGRDDRRRVWPRNPGLIATLVRKLVAIAPRSIFTFMIVMVGVLSSIAADAGYLVLVPLAAAAFHSMGRHPLAGLAAGFSGVAAVFLVNVFVTPTDALLVEVTNDAIRTVNPARADHRSWATCSS